MRCSLNRLQVAVTLMRIDHIALRNRHQESIWSLHVEDRRDRRRAWFGRTTLASNRLQPSPVTDRWALMTVGSCNGGYFDICPARWPSHPEACLRVRFSPTYLLHFDIFSLQVNICQVQVEIDYSEINMHCKHTQLFIILVILTVKMLQ